MQNKITMQRKIKKMDGRNKNEMQGCIWNNGGAKIKRKKLIGLTERPNGAWATQIKSEGPDLIWKGGTKGLWIGIKGLRMRGCMVIPCTFTQRIPLGYEYPHTLFLH